MAFRIARSETYKFPVYVSMPSEKGNGKFVREEFTAVWRRRTVSELEDLRGKSSADMIRECLADWEGVIDDDGSRVPFDEENVEIMISLPQALKGLAESFWESIVEAKAKN